MRVNGVRRKEGVHKRRRNRKAGRNKGTKGEGGRGEKRSPRRITSK